MNKEYFDSMAAGWDDNPVRRELALAVGKTILRQIPIEPSWSVLDYGCGTGALSAILSCRVRRIVAADSSEGMLEQVRKKVVASGLANISPVFLDLESQPPLAEKFDMVAMSMALHHIKDTSGVIGKLSSMLVPGGWFAAADLVKEDGSFHTDIAVPHNGFDTKELKKQFASGGLATSSCRAVHRIIKNEREYPVFMLIARKTGDHT